MLRKTVWLILVFSCLSACVARVPEEKFIRPRILKGKYTGEGDFPFMAALFYNGYYTCGASILSTEWILTAAHCLHNLDVKLFSIYVGTTVIDETSGINMEFSHMIPHEEYKPESNFPNDIAVMKLKTHIHFSPLVQPVALPYPMQQIESSTPVIIMGWGDTEYKTNVTTKHLQKAQLLVIDQEECGIVYFKHPKLKKRILPSHFCAGWPEGGVGQCTGDSGGPAVVEENGRYTQLGIISFSAKPCGVKGFPGIFTSLPHYRYWIKDKTGL